MCFDPFVTPVLATTTFTAPIGAAATVAVPTGASVINWGAILSAASLGATALGTVATISGQRAQAEAARRRGEYEAAVARNNAILAERSAEDAIRRGEIAEKRQRLQTRQLIGQQRVSAARQGQVVGEGSALDIVSDAAAIGELDALTIRRNAEREALGFRTQGMNFQASAELAQLRSFTPDTTLGTALAGTSTLADRFLLYRREIPSFRRAFP